MAHMSDRRALVLSFGVLLLSVALLLLAANDVWETSGHLSSIVNAALAVSLIVVLLARRR